LQTRTFEITVPISLPPTVSPHDLIENATSQIERELHDALGGEVHVAAALDLAASGSPLTGKLVLLGLGAAEKEASVADGDFEAFVIIIVRRALRLVFRSLEIHAEPNVRIAAVATNTADKPVRFWNRMELTPISSWIVPAFLGALGGILLLAVVITASWYSLSSAKHHPSTGLLASKTDPQFAAQKTTIDLEQAYREAIAKAAVRAPLKVRLATIDRNQPHVSVVHLSRYYPFERGKLLKDAGELPKDGRLAGDTWVALELELAALCRGKSDALLALNQILGLRHKESERDGLLVMHLKVAPADMFRPCVGASVIDRLCRLELSKTARDDFVLQQAWNTHRVGFEEDGYPFTGMGWSYNWAPDSPNHIGVTEFVVQKDAPANIIRTETPEEFCNLSGEAVGISGDKQSKPE
jgi:hypothetical protein